MRTSDISLLLIEDNLGDARLLREMLIEAKPHKTTLTHVPTIAAAELFIATDKVDIILLDLGLPDAQGVDGVRRAHAAAPHVPLVVLTGSDDEELAGRALKEGAQDYLIKGQIDSRGLLRALRYAIERKVMEEALFAEHERAQVALDCIGDAVACMDVAGNVTFLNRIAETMTGWKAKDATGLPIGEVFSIGDPDGASSVCTAGCHNDRLMHAVQNGETIGLAEEVFCRHDGSSFDAEYSSAPLRDSKGVLLGAVIAVRDVSGRRAMERLKDEFVSTVSHELRTPLTSIRGALGLLHSGVLGPLPPKGERMLQIAVTNTDRLIRLINDILDLERLESGKIELACSNVEAHDLIVLAVDGIQAMADAVGVTIVIEPFSAQIFADSDRIVQTVTNLLSNAVKFSPAGTAVTVSSVIEKGMLVIRVADRGRGIPEDKAAMIFERFKQVNASDSRDKGGSGLGLAISSSIVTAHGGRIWCGPNGDQGTIFSFTVPMTAPPPTAVAAAHARDTGDVADAPFTVLIAEDDEDLAGVMVASLEARGVRTLRAATGTEAVNLARTERPQLIVLDVGLPVLDGYAVVAALRLEELAREVPVLVYSALEVGVADQERLRLGPTAFLTKTKGSLRDLEVGIAQLLDAAECARIATAV